MGHGRKNANRGEAISRNTQRIRKLAEKHKALGEIVKDVRRELKDEIEEVVVVMNEYFEEIEERLRLLERPWWKKLLRMELEVKDAKEEEEAVRETSDDAEPPASDSGPEDAGAEEEKEGKA